MKKVALHVLAVALALVIAISVTFTLTSVLVDLATNATPRIKEQGNGEHGPKCASCNGTGWGNDGYKCSSCNGTGANFTNSGF